jgi:DNA-binding GntR family transcriptional regulator
VAIERRSLRTQIKAEVLERLARGEFDVDQRINEVHLAAQLGVSRTPLREALIALENEGVIQSESGKGFRFAPVSVAEFEELCPVLSTLEALALQLSSPAHLAAIAPELMAKATAFDLDQEEHGVIMRYDDEWHDLLLSGCQNTRLMDLITTLKVALHRYERLMVSDEEVLSRAASEHQQIARCLLDDDLTGAMEALRLNWANGMARVVAAMAAS